MDKPIMAAGPHIHSADSSRRIMLDVILALLPAAAFGLGLLLGLDNVSHGVSVLMTGMPAGATAAILAARYESDAEFATKCVVLSTLISMVTLPLWAHIVG